MPIALRALTRQYRVGFLKEKQGPSPPKKTQGLIQDFHLGGGGVCAKYCVRERTLRARNPKSVRQGSRARLSSGVARIFQWGGGGGGGTGAPWVFVGGH